MNPADRHPWSYAAGKREAKAWSQFGATQFPKYERFWRLFAVSQTRRAWHLVFLPDVAPLDRKSAWLNQRFSCGFTVCRRALTSSQMPKGLPQCSTSVHCMGNS